MFCKGKSESEASLPDSGPILIIEHYGLENTHCELIFNRDSAGDSLGAKAAKPIPWKPQSDRQPSNMMIFNIYSTNPSSLLVAPGAMKVDEFDSMLIVVHTRCEYDKATDSLRMPIDNTEHDLETRTVLLTPQSFLADEWRSLRAYEPERELHYEFGMLPIELQKGKEMCRIMEGLLCTGENLAPLRFDAEEDDNDGSMATYLHQLESYKVVRCVLHHPDGIHSSWELTPAGTLFLFRSPSSTQRTKQ